MNLDLRNQEHLVEQAGQVVARRPLIGVTMGREKSQRFFGLSLFIMNQTYVRSLENLGALPVMIPLNMTEATLYGTLQRLDGLFLPGGEDIDPSNYGEERHPLLGATDRERDRTELLLTRWALQAGMPIFGVCRGVQMINVACGGTLVQDLHSERPDLEKHDYFPPSYERYRISHSIAIESHSHLAQALGQVHEVNSMHHQGIEQVGHGLRVVARADDGLVEALEAPELPFVVGVQWHPEELSKTDQMSAKLFYNFVAAAAGDWRQEVAPEWAARFAALCLAQPSNGDGPGYAANGGASAPGEGNMAASQAQVAQTVMRGNCG